MWFRNRLSSLAEVYTVYGKQSKATCAQMLWGSADVMAAVCLHHFPFGARQILRTSCALNGLYETLRFQENYRRSGDIVTELRDAGTDWKPDSGVGRPWSTCQYQISAHPQSTAQSGHHKAALPPLCRFQITAAPVTGLPQDQSEGQWFVLEKTMCDEETFC